MANQKGRGAEIIAIFYGNNLKIIDQVSFILLYQMDNRDRTPLIQFLRPGII